MKKTWSDAAIWKKIKTGFDPGTIGLAPEVWKDFCGRMEKMAVAAVKAPDPKHFILHIDGAARNNPGPAGIGIVISDAAGKIIREYGDYIGEETNNVAEYRALLKALELAAELGAEKLDIRTDSELMAHQMNGRYRVKNIHLLNLYFEAQEKLQQFPRFSIQHVPRGQNRRADVLANMAIDAKEI